MIMQFSLSGKKANAIFKTLTISLSKSVMIEQTDKKLLFSDGSMLYGEYDREYFDEYTADSYDRIKIKRILFSSLFKAKYSKKVDQYQIHFPFDEWLKQGHYGIHIKEFVSNDLKGNHVRNVDVPEIHIEKPFFFKDQVPVFKSTNIPLTTCLTADKKELKILPYERRCQGIYFRVDTKYLWLDCQDTSRAISVNFKKNPQTFSNLYNPRLLGIIPKFETHPTIYTAPGGPLLCINNFPDYRVAVIIPAIIEEQKARKRNRKRISPG